MFVTYNINEAVALGDRVIVLSLKLANIKKELAVDLRRPRQLDHPLIDSITREIIEESKDLYFYSSYCSVTNSHNRSEYEIVSTKLSR